MEKIKTVAIVKLDPADSHSTGGIVEWIGTWEIGEENDGTIVPQPYQDSNGNIQNGYKAIELSESDKTDAGYPFDESVVNPNGVKIGWILQNKTNMLRDPNS